MSDFQDYLLPCKPFGRVELCRVPTADGNTEASCRTFRPTRFESLVNESTSCTGLCVIVVANGGSRVRSENTLLNPYSPAYFELQRGCYSFVCEGSFAEGLSCLKPIDVFCSMAGERDRVRGSRNNHDVRPNTTTIRLRQERLCGVQTSQMTGLRMDVEHWYLRSGRRRVALALWQNQPTCQPHVRVGATRDDTRRVRSLSLLLLTVMSSPPCQKFASHSPRIRPHPLFSFPSSCLSFDSC
ncbi:hypothetical protein SCHPADRAFT_736745 [Schizopora paradoxa]|uniref:Uncharacterized protein n=1 Tax=Schizopora paradoxa TaxID=27342 RepID=A0A0H2RJY6_9AGAM|nr:hypothetical protein SCHPADRAFT_736745 [Schizopora paradoxa]